ncbi:MAG TPA: LON peptidase substrate-binding domain-containing protein [Casimicrobium sp.]|nr:LON peptidase substrate-binding domain-containing protein [Casimicrobium sp.]
MLSFLMRKRATSLPDTLPLFPLGATLFPGGRLGLKVFEQRYLELAKARIADSGLFGVVTLTSGSEVGAAQTFAKVGTAARVRSYDVPQAGIFLLDVVGEDRFEVLRTSVDKSGLHQADVRWIKPEPQLKLPSEHGALGLLLAQIIERNGKDKFAEPIAIDDATWVGSRLAEALPLPPSIKQTLLEINDASLRLNTIRQLLARMSNAAATGGSGQPS